MNPLNIQSGWWVSTDERFVRCYNTREEAISHVKYQQVCYSNVVPNFIDPKNYLFSIPTNQIGLNPNLKQNPGWD